MNRSNHARQRAFRAAQVAEENRGRDIVILDLTQQTSIFDYFVVVTGTSRRQLHAISDEIEHALVEMGDRRMGIEGYEESRWVLLDFGDVVIHLFDEEARRYYRLEDLWGQAPRTPFPAQQPAGAASDTSSSP